MKEEVADVCVMSSRHKAALRPVSSDILLLNAF